MPRRERARGRPRKYHTEEQRIAARKLSNQKAYQKRRRIAEQKKADERDLNDTWDAMMGMEEQSTRKRNDELKEEVRNLMNLPLTHSITKTKQKKNDQFSKAMYAISHNQRSFEFNIPEKPDDEFLEKLGAVMESFLSKITYNTRWLVLYCFQGKWRIRKLDETTSAYFRTQMSKEGMIDMMNDYITYTEDYDFFPVAIKSLQQLRIVNLDRYDIDGGSSIIDANEVAALTTPRIHTRKRRREGMFWGWTLTIPHIDLSRYMIFNRLNMDAAKMIESDNCLIYACKMAGVDVDTLSHMRNVIQTRSFTIEKLKDISRECGINFTIRDEGKRKHTITKGNGRYTVKLVLMHNHYMIDERVPLSPYYIRHIEEIRKSKQLRYWKKSDKMLVSGINGKGVMYKSKENYSIISVIKALFEVQAFKAIRLGDYCTFMSCIREEKILPIERLEYNSKFCCRLKEGKREPVEEEGKREHFKRQHICYFDFECSTDGTKHLPYCVCSIRSVTNANGETKWIRSAWYSSHCATDFLDSLDTNTLCYAHNLSYDINFLIHHMTYIHNGAIIKSGRVMQMTAVYGKGSKEKVLMFKDTYSIISTKLSRFPSMFHLESGMKEAFPYTYYNSTRIGDRYGSVNEALQHFKTESERDTFVTNIEKLGMRNQDQFNMKKYCEFYCNQDVNILYQGFEWFRSSLIDAFGLDTYDFISISSIANRYMEQHCYWKNGNLYDLSNTPRDFISRCIIGGRCMIADNEKQKSTDDLVDFDAVSLYPSAMNRLYCLEGMPKVIPDEMLTSTYLMDHLFTDYQIEPTVERFISAFFVHIEITSIQTHRHFPLIVSSDGERSSNVCCEMYVDHIQFEDLIRYQGCECKVIRGYYYDGNRDTTIRNVITDLFEMRLKYKREGNPLQEIIKLLLNSIYGKTILKPITDTVKFIPKDDTIDYFDRRYNHVKEIENTMDKFCKVTEMKSITRHFTFVPLGVNILSMSKRIMNEVMCLAEDLHMKLYYQDTDSMHLKRDDLERLSVEYGKRYKRDLIGKSMGQFHSDFPTVGGVMPIAKRSIFCGKKCYIDELHGGEGEIAYHVRMKGVPLSVIVNRANEVYNGNAYIGSDGLVHNGAVVYKLYEELYNGSAMDMDLTKGDSPCFERGKAFTVSTKKSFVRSIRF